MERRSRLRNVVLSREPEPPLPGAAFRDTGERGDDLLFSAPPEGWSLCAVDGRPLPPLQSPEEVGRLDGPAGIFDELPPRDRMRGFSVSATWYRRDVVSSYVTDMVYCSEKQIYKLDFLYAL